MKIRSVAVVALVMSLLALAPRLNAAPIYIDFSSKSAGALTPDASGRHWNTLGATGTGLVLQNAVDADNNATTVDLNVLSPFKAEITSGTTSSVATDFPSAVTEDSWYADYRASGGQVSDASIRIEGLDPNTQYTLGFYGSNKKDSFRGLGITIGTETQDQDFQTGVIGTSAQGETWLVFNDVTPSVNGEITFSVARLHTYQYLGAMVITPVPEPAALSLVGLIGCMALRRPRR